MPLDLPPAFGDHLPRSPLALVACQLRYGEPATPVTASSVAAMRTELAGSDFPYPKVDQVQLQNISIDVSAGTANRDPAGRAWRLQTADNRWIVTVAPESLAIETTRYGSWDDDFRARLHALLAVFSRIVLPEVETRLGLRYVDILNDPRAAHASEWRGWLADGLLGPIAHPVLGEGVIVIQQQFTIEIDAEVRATVRHGAYPDPSQDSALTYLIDTDVYRENLVPFNEANLLDATDRLHDLNLRLFQQLITPKMFDRLRTAPAQSAS